MSERLKTNEASTAEYSDEGLTVCPRCQLPKPRYRGRRICKDCHRDQVNSARAKGPTVVAELATLGAQPVAFWVGRSANHRAHLATWCPLETATLLALKGGGWVEQRLHARLAPWQLKRPPGRHGRWYAATPAALDALFELTQAPRPPWLPRAP